MNRLEIGFCVVWCVFISLIVPLLFLSIMSSTLLHQPGDLVNEVYSEKIQQIIQICFDVGDDPTSLIEQAKRELQVTISSFSH